MENGIDKDLLMRRIAAAIALIVVLGFFGMGVMLTFQAIPAGNKEMFLQYSGALILAFGGLMTFLFNRSNSEAQERSSANVAAAAAATAATVATTAAAAATPPTPPTEPEPKL